MKPSYYQMLKDPRWQRKRLERLQRSEFACDHCSRKDVTLHVHHLIYRKGAAPWEYANSELAVYCEDCHEFWHHAKAALDEAISHIADIYGLVDLVGYAQALAIVHDPLGEVTLYNGDSVQATAAALKCSDDDLIEFAVMHGNGPVRGVELVPWLKRKSEEAGGAGTEH